MSARKRRLVFSEVQTRKALRLAREAYGDAARVVIGPDGSLAIEKAPDEKARKRQTVADKDFVL